MKLKSVEIENYRAIEKLKLPLDPSLTVLHGDNGYGKTSVLSAIAVGLDMRVCSDRFSMSSLIFPKEDWREGAGNPRISLTSMDGNVFERQGTKSVVKRKKAEEEMSANRENLEKALVENSRAESKDMPIGCLYGTDRAVSGMYQNQ